MRVTIIKAENGYIVLIGELTGSPKSYIHESLEEVKNRIDFIFR